MNCKFTDLVRIYRKAKFVDGFDRVEYSIENQEELDLLEKLSSADNCETTQLYIENGPLQLGKQVTLQVDSPSFDFGRIFLTLKDFIDSDMVFLWDERKSKSPFYIVSLKLASFDNYQSPVISSYYAVKKFILVMEDMAVYTDRVNRKLIFVSKKTLKISFDVSKKLDGFRDEIDNITKKLCDQITKFSQWLSNKETSSHYDEKKSILAFVLVDTLPETPDIIDVLRRIKKISEAVQAQYGLYLENFSYAKFVKKLEENSEKFVTRINDTISKILPQLLGLPFLAAIVTALNAGDNLLVYMALFIYSLISILALNYQNAVLNDIRDEIENYVKNGNIPEALIPQWTGYRIKFYKLIKKQKWLYRVLLASAIPCCLYCLYKLFYCEPVHSSISTLQEWIIAYINSVRR